MTTNHLPVALYQAIPYGDPDAFTDWNIHHMLIHQELAKKTRTAYVPLDSLRTDGFPHGQLHRHLAEVLGASSEVSFADYDLNDQESFNDFMRSHAAHHAELNQLAGL